MATRSRYFEGALDIFLPFYFIKVEVEMLLLRIKFFARVDDSRFDEGVAVKDADDVAEVTHAIDFERIDNRSFTSIVHRYEQSLVLLGTCHYGDGQSATDRENGAVESEFTDEHVAVERTDLQKADGNHVAECHRQVKTRTFLAHVSWRKVDNGAAWQQCVALSPHCCLHTFLTFLHGTIRKSDDGEPLIGAPFVSIDLDGHRDGVQPLHAG